MPTKFGLKGSISDRIRAVFSFEFTLTGKPDIPKGKGVPANIKRFVDGNAVGEGELPVAIALSIEIGAGLAIGARHRFRR